MTARNAPETTTERAPTEVRSCLALTANDRPCRAPPLQGSDFCFWHDPNRASERTAARKRGGYRARGLDPEAPVPEVHLSNVIDVLDLLKTAAQDCLRHRPSLARARALAHIANTAAKVLESQELRDRVEDLENRTAVQAMSDDELLRAAQDILGRLGEGDHEAAA